MKHLLLSCSDDKLNVSVPIPALERYNGPAYKTLRKLYDDRPEMRFEISTAIISAKYGLVHLHTLVPRYNQRMTAERAQIFKKTIPAQLAEWIRGPHPETGMMENPTFVTSYPLYDLQMNGASDDALEAEAIADEAEDSVLEQEVADIETPEGYVSPQVFCMLGRDYRPIVEPLEAWLPEGTTIHYAQGSLVSQRLQLLAWLHDKPIPVVPKAGRRVGLARDVVPGGAVTHAVQISGIQVNMTVSEIEQMVDELLQDPGNVLMSQRTKRWVAIVGEHRVSPKWLVSQITKAPTSTFDAASARRVLAQLGIATQEYTSNPFKTTEGE